MHIHRHYLTVLNAANISNPSPKRDVTTQIHIASHTLTVPNDRLEILSDAELDQFSLGDGNLTALEVTRHPRSSVDHLELSKSGDSDGLSIHKVLSTRVGEGKVRSCLDYE